MRSRRSLSWSVGLLLLAALPRWAAADEAPQDDQDCDAWARYFGVRVQVLYNNFQDLEITSRRIKRNDLGFGFPQGTVSAQNEAEHKSWRESTQVVELVVDPFATENRDFAFFLGVGGRQADSDFGTGNGHHNSDPLFSFGAFGALGRLSEDVRLDWEGRVTRTEAELTGLDEVPGADESLEIKALSYSVRLTAAFPLYPDGPPGDGAIGYEPYAGVLFYHLDVEEEFVANAGPTSKSRVEFDVESPSGGELRGIAGLRLLGLHPNATLSVEGSAGSRSYGLGLNVDIRF